MANVNEAIIRKGVIVEACKLAVLTFSLGLVGLLKSLADVIIRINGETRLVTKEAPGGCRYDDDWTAVVRVIGGKVFMGMFYDLYALSPAAAIKKLKNKIDVELTEEQRAELAPIFAVASEVKAYLTPEERRNVVIITPELANLIGDDSSVMCHNEWDDEGILTPLHIGDVFVISDIEKGLGYRIGADEFKGTHSIR